ncbi:hypothetical protein LBM2029_22870 (plasmid) [Ralstonia solanacearum]|nr:hypothetical protein LBM2029_22870 [Ralstonia solanacearum]
MTKPDIVCIFADKRRAINSQDIMLKVPIVTSPQESMQTVFFGPEEDLFRRVPGEAGVDE